MHWQYLRLLSNEAKWLACYVSLSRPKSLQQLLSHGLPSRDLIEGGPPEAFHAALDELFQKKIAKTKIDMANARTALAVATGDPWDAIVSP